MRDSFGFEDEQFSFQPEFDPESDFEFPGQGLEAEAPPQTRQKAVRQTYPPSAKAINARILWPALGFPAVIAPQPGSSAKPFDSDATRSICVLILSDKPQLTPEDAARYLRYAPWERRRTRTIKAGDPGSFSPKELDVRNKIERSNLVDKHSQGFRFGANPQRRNGVAVSLSKYVTQFYGALQIKYLHEIRVSEAASNRLANGQYHLFWNKEIPDGDDSSPEMKPLLTRFAEPRRKKELGQGWSARMKFLMDEYKYEYGGLHEPYKPQEKPGELTEVLHPLFVRRGLGAQLRIGHVTDTHVDVRNDVYERNIGTRYRGKPIQFNNWNKSFLKVYESCNGASDVILMTGDLIDYGRGHIGDSQAGSQLANNNQYHKDRNWFLFYYLLLKGGGYKNPVFTCLGNHDWRLNPYPPFAPNTPGATRFVHNDLTGFSEKEQNAILEAAHGPGFDRAFSYSLNVNRWFLDKGEALVKRPKAGLKYLVTGDLDVPESPVNTDVESIAWYLLLINPFLDYQCAFPTGHEFLMLDFAEDEELQKFDPKTFREYGERAKKCLTSLQQWHVSLFTTPGGKAKTIGIHTPPIGPREDWYVKDLLAGVRRFDSSYSGYSHRYDLPNQTIVEWREHALYAFRPMMNNTHGWNNAPLGIAADYGSFVNKDTKDTREWFIRKVADPRAGVRAVFAGHIHRQGLLTVYRQRDDANVYRVRAVVAADVKGVRPPGVALRDGFAPPGPLYVNTTSAGPRGNYFVPNGPNNPPKSLPQEPGFTVVTMASDGTLLGATALACSPAKACAFAASTR